MEGMIGEVRIFGGNFAPAPVQAASQEGHEKWIPIEGLFHGANRNH